MKMDGGSKKRASMRGSTSYMPRSMAEVTTATKVRHAGLTPGGQRKGRSMADVSSANPVKPC